MDALRYIQAHDSNWETLEVTKGNKDKSKSRNKNEEYPNAATNFTTLVYGSPVRKLYNTSTVTSPIRDDYLDENQMPSKITKNQQMTTEKGKQLNLKIKDNFWNSKRKHI